MNCYFGRMIARYNAAKDSLTTLLASNLEITDSEIANADRELNEAFEAIMQAVPRDNFQVQARIRFIAEQINERCEGQEIIKQMTRRMLDDVSQAFPEKDSSYIDMLHQAG